MRGGSGLESAEPWTGRAGSAVTFSCYRPTDGWFVAHPHVPHRARHSLTAGTERLQDSRVAARKILAASCICSSIVLRVAGVDPAGNQPRNSETRRLLS